MPGKKRESLTADERDFLEKIHRLSPLEQAVAGQLLTRWNNGLGPDFRNLPAVLAWFRNRVGILEQRWMREGERGEVVKLPNRRG